MKWSYTDGKLNVSSEEVEQQFLLKELIEEASRHQAYQKKIILLFVILSLVLFFLQSYGGDLPTRRFYLFLYRLLCYTFNFIRNNLINDLCINEETSKAESGTCTNNLKINKKFLLTLHPPEWPNLSCN